ncbi:hypothetical protein ZYGR_0AK07420 [Zygosaccharomyces rouxii]|uniref:Uncharacterized protein n=1 Tax=Zygosaccharomyces rouxii TaxID=4956 RepID=A0A1Q3AF17_ZYGRO|nr:hypothetical protein ZYGR_0AK07420 [Zygosaccharomyces rouxii]
MSVPFAKLLNSLVSKSSPESIYHYKSGRLLRAGGLGLSLVFLSYGITFIDWYYHSSWEVWSGANDDDKKSWKFCAKTFGPWGLTIIPFTVAGASLYFPSRVVTKVTYIPRANATPLCQLERKSALFGRRLQLTRPLDQLARSERTKVYTGVGEQGVEDKGSFVFLLYDGSPKCRGFWDKYYILHRSGKFWGHDGRVFDALFGGDSIKDLEKRGRLVAQGKNFNTKQSSPPPIKETSDNVSEIIARNNRAKFHVNGESQLSRKIVGSTNVGKGSNSQKSKQSK